MASPLRHYVSSGSSRRAFSSGARPMSAMTDEYEDDDNYFDAPSDDDDVYQDNVPPSLIPPTLDDLEYDDGYGASTYQVDDVYELQEWKRQEEVERNFLYGKQQSTSSKDDERANNASPSRPRTFANTQINPPVRPTVKEPHLSSVEIPSRTAPVPSSTPSASPQQPSFSAPTLEELQAQLEQLTKDIYQANNGQEFNIKSPAQVSKVLFGSQGGSTEKTVLEAKAAAGHVLSDLILKYRATVQAIRRIERNTSANRVPSATTVQRSITKAIETNDQVEESPATTSRNQEVATDPLILIDASAYIFRAYYSMPPIHRYDGMPTGAVMGFCNMLNKLALDEMVKAQQSGDEASLPRMVLVFDAKGKTFRHDIYQDYKANRPDAPVDLIPQFQLVRQAARAYGICQLEADTYEADDVIATLATMALEEGIDVNIFSGDKDLMQLVTETGVEPSVQMIDPATLSRVAYEQVVEKWGLPPGKLLDALALAGDSADNIPGVPGIGPKIAAQLLQEYDTLDNLLANVDKIPQKARRQKLEEFSDQARLSRDLVQLVHNVPMELMSFPNGTSTVADLRIEPLNVDRILAFYDEMGFQDIKRRFLNTVRQSNGQSKLQKPKRTNRKPAVTVPKPEDFSDVPF